MVKRYKEVFDPNHSQECICHRGPMNRGLEESPEGDFVDIEDYEELNNQLAKAKERVKELELHANSIADALEFNAENNNRFATSVICTNIRNLHSFSDCLSRIENAFLMVESETDEFGETSEDVAFSKWGLTPHEYCIEFGKWLNKFALEQQIEGIESSIAYAEGKSHFVDVSDLQDYIEQLRKEQE